LHAHPPVTLLGYYSKFMSVSGGLATATGIGPLVSAWLPGSAPAYFFPPLGEITMPARLGVVVLSVAITYISFYGTRPEAKVFQRFLWVGVISLLALTGYLLSYGHFVRKIDAPANDSALFVSVGYERTVFAEQTFHSESDWDLLRARGTSEEEVAKLWTAQSLHIARLCLIASYSAFILPLVLIFSLGVRYQM
jgi:hypothetical protein